MASQFFFLIIVIVAPIVPSVLATEFIVGDEGGWRINYDYQAWAVGKEFRVGDKLVFKYPEGAHNVHKVDGTGFQNCIVPVASTEALTSGNDVITLSSPGRKWYICGVGKHCEVGQQKLAITVLPLEGAPASSPTTSSPAPTSDASLKFAGLMAPLFTAFLGFLFL